jgi:hypothetical protein
MHGTVGGRDAALSRCLGADKQQDLCFVGSNIRNGSGIFFVTDSGDWLVPRKGGQTESRWPSKGAETTTLETLQADMKAPQIAKWIIETLSAEQS